VGTNHFSLTNRHISKDQRQIYIMIGKIINNYIIERKLGDGGMGVVYYAKHNKVDREVAIKVLHSDLFFNESIHNRFKNEANALIKLNHPNIVKIFDYVEQENFACLIMEYINGYTLDDYIAKVSGPLSSEKVISIIIPVLEAVQYAHDNNVYHRDIKPANIMISQDGNKVRIMDFGIAKLTDSKNFKTTHANTQLGTPFYMSPEQIKGMPYSRMSDIYSLGVTLFEMVTGTCPYHEITSLFDLQSKIVNQPLPHTSDFYPGVSQRIQNAITIATQKSPEHRFQSCADFINYLRDTHGQTIIVRPTNTSFAKPLENRTIWAASIIGGVFLIVILIFVIKSATNHSPSKPETTTTAVEINKGIDPAPPKQDPPPVVQPPTVQELNLNLLDTYLAGKQKKLSTPQLNEIRNQVKALKDLSSPEKLGKKYDPYFVEKPLVKYPSKDQIRKDFWDVIVKAKKTDYCRVLYEDTSQISVSIDFKHNMKDSPNEILIPVNFTISPKDDESEKEHCSLTLIYSKSGNEYLFDKVIF
jgi:serine/threonine protein kinase